MSSGLKNAGATYQCAITVIFHDMLYDYNEDYVDDIATSSGRFNDLRQVFLGVYLRMNPLKWAFKFSSVNSSVRSPSRGINLDPAKAKAIQDMESLKSSNN